MEDPRNKITVTSLVIITIFMLAFLLESGQPLNGRFLEKFMLS